MASSSNPIPAIASNSDQYNFAKTQAFSLPMDELIRLRDVVQGEINKRASEEAHQLREEEERKRREEEKIDSLFAAWVPKHYARYDWKDKERAERHQKGPKYGSATESDSEAGLDAGFEYPVEEVSTSEEGSDAAEEKRNMERYLDWKLKAKMSTPNDSDYDYSYSSSSSSSSDEDSKSSSEDDEAENRQHRKDRIRRRIQAAEERRQFLDGVPSDSDADASEEETAWVFTERKIKPGRYEREFRKTMKQIEAEAEAEEDSDSDDPDTYPDFIDDADSYEEDDSDDKSDNSDDENDSDDESDNPDESDEYLYFHLLFFLKHLNYNQKDHSSHNSRPKRTVRAPTRYRSAHAESGSSANVRVAINARRRRSENSVTVVEVEDNSNRVGEDFAESVEVEDRVHARWLRRRLEIIKIHKATEAADAISLTTALLEEEKMLDLESARVDKAVQELKTKNKIFQKKLDRVAYRD
ncbi:uncharacterized protein LOC113312198 [Papaver somniferum]|uniref:uncharacterized protein LOC113312198 n=1 Tax=Papaver somniferum TaxID=3469 RepID=UPI000E6FBE11|nr:uncharacterized protein LOC113312198 [Papaver somniferum]